MYWKVIDFWFEDIEPKQWFKKDPAFDQLLRDHFGDLHKQATACELSGWRREPLGALAEVILLDQFSRNIYREQPGAFASDSLALALAQNAIAIGHAEELTQMQCNFLYMPFMHSESALIQQESIRLFEKNGIEGSLNFAHRHKDIIDRFGRYPHRNDILGRASTEEELEFLRQPGSSF